MKYQVEVGNVGTVYDGDDSKEAWGHFHDYCAISKRGEGHAAGESVTLFEDGEPVSEYVGDADRDGDN